MLRLAAQAGAGAIELRSTGGASHLSITRWGGAAEESILRDYDGNGLEAARVARVREGDALDAQLAHREAAILRAVEAALESGAAEPVAAAGTRSTLRLLAGGALAPSPRAGALHLV